MSPLYIYIYIYIQVELQCCKASGGKVEPFFPSLFAKIAAGKDISKFLKIGGGGGGAKFPAVPAGSGSGSLLLF